jgi:hypothetical protein
LVSDNSIIRSLGFQTEIDLPQLAKMMIHGS